MVVVVAFVVNTESFCVLHAYFCDHKGDVPLYICEMN